MRQVSSKTLVFLFFSFIVVRVAVILATEYFIYDLVIGRFLQEVLLSILTGRHVIPLLLSILLVHTVAFICLSFGLLALSELLFLPVIARIFGSWSFRQVAIVDKPRVAEVIGGLLMNIIVVSRNIVEPGRRLIIILV